MPTIEVLFNIFLVLMAPFAFHALVTRAKWPESVLSKFHRAEPRLAPASNLLLVILGFFALAQLAVQFGWMSATTAQPIIIFFGLAILMASVVLIALWIVAIRKANRMTVI